MMCLGLMTLASVMKGRLDSQTITSKAVAVMAKVCNLDDP